jgi:broad specificity phosphatase PhoE
MRWATARWALRLRLRSLHRRLTTPRSGRRFVKKLMDSLNTANTTASTGPSVNGAHPQNGTTPDTAVSGVAQAAPPARPARLLLLVRHGETTYNVEKRLPGQLPGVALTDEGRRQAHRAAVALSNLPLSAVVSSPLERAKETAEILARGWALPVRLDPRLMDTDIGPWASKQLDELNKNEPAWKAYVEKPSAPPKGVEGFTSVQARSVAAVNDILADASLGSYIALVAHADVVKLILAYYTETPVDCARFTAIANASISALLFGDDPKPHLLAVNWTAFPGWLAPFSLKPPQAQEPALGGATEPAVQPGEAAEPPPSTVDTR